MPTKLTKKRGKTRDVQNLLETPAFQSMNQSAITPPAASVTPVDVGVGGGAIAKPNDLAPIESGVGSMVNTVA